ncbi:MAG TPA: cytidine deaminase [Bacteroidetes bacterium]|nr:cytidine deaminase [Bacteroidota bacterium]
MRRLEIKTVYSEYTSEKELPEEDQALLQKAKKALKQSYSPYSHFKVGAAALLENGKTVISANYENASYPSTVCAEHSALIQAANRYPKSPVVALAITVLNSEQVIEDPAMPCGSCRQVICETEGRNGQDMRVILQGEKGKVHVFERGGDMLPLAFDGGFL